MALLTIVAGCSETLQLVPDPLANLDSLEVSPADATLTITDLSQPPQSLDFHAIGRFSDGTRRDITTQIAWSVDNQAPGSFVEFGTYVTSNAAAGHIVVTATGDILTATATLTVIVDATIIDTAFPPSDPSLFAPGATLVVDDPTNSPELLYPADGTRFPQNVSQTLFQFARGAGNDAFQLTFDSDVLHLVVLTGSDRWNASDVLQTLLSQSSIDMPIEVAIQAASSAAPGTVYAGPSIALEFEHDDPAGILYYWSAATSGIMRGALGATSASKLYPGDATCVGCHATSRDGLQMAMGYGTEATSVLQTIDVATLATETDASAMIGMGWAAYSPDATMVLVANNGQLTLRDARTGTPIGTDGKVHLPVGRYGTHPDWSPDSTYVVFAYTASVPTNIDVKAASIARMSFDPITSTFGTPEILVAAGATDNDYFPKYSPDGKFIAYVHATTSSHAATSAELQLIGATGGVPILLDAASHRVGPVDDMQGVSDTMPAWSPYIGSRSRGSRSRRCARTARCCRRPGAARSGSRRSISRRRRRTSIRRRPRSGYRVRTSRC